ncbi:MAG: hypothetical protein ABI721_04990 [Candidatus Dojkabacteria bacterium]
MKNSAKILFLTFLFPLILPFHLSAQDTINTDIPAEIKDFEGLRAEFKQQIQDPESKNVTFTMVLKSNINSDRVKIEWSVTGASKIVNQSEQRKNLDIKEGQTYNISITVTPTGEGVSEVYGTAQSVNVDSSFLVTVRKNFGSNNDLEVLPISTEYQSAKTFVAIKNIVIVVVLIGIGVALAFLGFRRLVKYLKSEPEVTFEDEVKTT